MPDPRHPIRSSATALIGFLLALSVVQPAAGEERADWLITVARADEPGQRLVVSGQVFADDGETPLGGVEVYVYQTDSTGNYSADGLQNRDASRLRGTAITDSTGRYELHTIRPGRYPGNRVPAHIHYVITPPGGDSENHDLFFSDDPALSPRQRAAGESDDSFSSVRPARASPDGVLQVTRDIRLEVSAP